jgi:[ribosomal protein S5]-alanine N-acetyltransferase
MVETERLILKPLTYEQLIKEAFEQTILPNVPDTTKNYLFSTLWTAISKIGNKMIGDLCIVGV